MILLCRDESTRGSGSLIVSMTRPPDQILRQVVNSGRPTKSHVSLDCQCSGALGRFPHPPGYQRSESLEIAPILLYIVQRYAEVMKPRGLSNRGKISTEKAKD